MRATHWTRLLPLAATVAGIGSLLSFVLLRPAPIDPFSRIGYVVIDLSALDFELELEDLHAAGILLGSRCSKCDFSAEGVTPLVVDQDDPAFQATMIRDEDFLHLSFYGEDVRSGEQRLSQSVELLRGQFPRNEGAIDLVAGRLARLDAGP